MPGTREMGYLGGLMARPVGDFTNKEQSAAVSQASFMFRRRRLMLAVVSITACTLSFTVGA